MKKVMFMLAAAAAIIAGCTGSPKEPGPEFAAYIKAYTGGTITDHSTVKVEFSTTVPGAEEGVPVQEGLLTFSPAIAGHAVWLSSTSAEFVPSEGALKPGQAYKATLHLDKALGIKDKKLKDFIFRLRVAMKEALLSAEAVYISPETPDKARLRASLLLSEPLEKEEAAALVSYDGEGTPVLVPGSDKRSYTVEIENVTREKSDRIITVSLVNANGFKSESSAEFTVPGTGSGFSVLSSRMSEGSDPYVEVLFTEPLAGIEEGLAWLDGTGRWYSKVKDNALRLYYENSHGSTVSAHVSEGVRSSTGKRLDAPYNASFIQDQPKPAVEIPVKGNILPDSKKLILPFRAVSLNAVNIRVIKIYEDNILGFLQDNDLSGDDQLRRSGRLILSKCIRLDTDPDLDLHRWQDFSVDLSGLFRQEKGAIYRIRLTFNRDYSIYGEEFTVSDKMRNVAEGELTAEEADIWDSPDPYYWESFYDWDKYDWKDTEDPLKPSYYMQSDRFPSINLLTSDIGVTAKYAGGDKLWVSASSIMSAKPVYGVDFEVYNYQLRLIGRGKSDSDGLEEISLSGKPFALVAKRGGSTSYLKLADGREKSLSRFDVGGVTVEDGMKSYIYGERGVWRPSDTLNVTMILQEKGTKLPDAMPATVELYTPQGQFYTKMVRSAEDGFYSFRIPTKSDDPTGIWNAWFKVGGASFHKSLRIETVKPNRLKINVDTEKMLKAGTKTPMAISSNWLTGPAAAGLTASASMTLSRAGSTFPGFDGYTFVNPASSFTRSESELFETLLDGAGRARIQAEMPVAYNAPGMLSADILFSVEEEGGDESYTSLTLPYSPFSAYVGVRLPQEGGSGWVETDTDHTIKVATVSPEGKRLSGHKLEWRIYKLDWSWWWESRASELDSYINGPDAKLHSSGNLVSAGNDVEIPFRVDYPDWGRYLVLVHDTDSGHSAGGTVLVDWPEYRGRSSKTDPDGLTMITFSTDKNSYSPGETATVYLPGAEGGRALVSLENSTGVISRTWVPAPADGSGTYKFKVTPEMAPNFYVHITLLQPHGGSVNDLPVRMYGVQPVLVDNKQSHLEPVISMADAVHPEETFTVRISEKSGRPMTYTLAIVDEGLLDLTAFRTPDPWSSLYAREALGVRTWDLYDEVIGAFSGRFSPLYSIGGDEQIRLGAKKDNRFNPVVKYLGPFTLKSGTASHEITLPMYVGSVRVMVVAGHDGAYGNAEKTVTVRSPLMVLPTVPRVMGTGESFVLPVNVFALEDSIKEAVVSIGVEGSAEIDGAGSARLHFSSPGDQIARFRIKAKGEGTARITVMAEGGGKKASETINLPVRNPNPPAKGLRKTVIEAGANATIVYPEGSRASLELASFPSVNFGKLWAGMESYAYNCTEQLSAKGINIVYTKDLLSPSDKASAEAAVPALLQELYGRQLADGGFTYWPGGSSADTWATSMAGLFLIRAEALGFDVSKNVISSWLQFQKRAVQNYRQRAGNSFADLDQAFRLYSLAIASQSDLAAMNRLKESSGIGIQAKWMLAAAYAASGKNAIAADMTAGIPAGAEAYDTPGPTFGSSLRDKSITLETLVLTGNIGEAVGLASDIAGQIDRYCTTQETAFASIALGHLAEKANTGALRAEIKQGGQTSETESAKAQWTCSLDGSGTVQIKNNSEGAIHASVVYTEASPVAAKASSEGLSVEVSWRRSDGGTVNPAAIAQGTDFISYVTVRNTSAVRNLSNLALVEAIPSGWEIQEGRFSSDPDAENFSYNDIRDDRSIWYFDLPGGTAKTFRLKLRAAYEGEYSLPSITCEAMYDTSVSGATASGKAAVTR